MEVHSWGTYSMYYKSLRNSEGPRYWGKPANKNNQNDSRFFKKGSKKKYSSRKNDKKDIYRRNNFEIKLCRDSIRYLQNHWYNNYFSKSEKV